MLGGGGEPCQRSAECSNLPKIMVRLRLGRSWKHERENSPVDSVGLSLDGVELLSGASEEPLSTVVPEWVSAVHALGVSKRRTAQVSLPESRLELALVRQDEDVWLSLVSFSRPVRQLRAPVRLPFSNLAEAVVRSARQYAADLLPVAPEQLKRPRHRTMLRQLDALERVELAAAFEFSPERFRLEQPPKHALGFVLEDPNDLLRSYDGKDAWALPSLLVEGALLVSRDGAALAVEGPPLLLAMELSRQADDLVAFVDAREEPAAFKLAGHGPLVRRVESTGQLEITGTGHSFALTELARRMYELALSLVLSVVSRHRLQAKNPYLLELKERCTAGLSHLREQTKPAKPVGAPKTRARRQKPLRGEGHLRRLRFEARWEKSGLLGDEPGRLWIDEEGPVFSSSDLAAGFTHEGGLRFRRVSTHGVAMARSGQLLAATGKRLVAFEHAGKEARWLRDHDGTPIGSFLGSSQGVLLAKMDRRGAVAFHSITGRELWRFVPPRAQRSHLSLGDGLAFLATDSCSFFGLDLQTGEVRYRLRSALPFLGPPLAWGRRLLGVLSRGERTSLACIDADGGKIEWTRDLELGAPSEAVIAGGQVIVAGALDDQAWVFCVGSQGAVRWQRRLELSPKKLSLSRAGRLCVAQDAAGAAVAFGSNSHPVWRVEPEGEELAVAVPPRLSRGVLFLAGEQVRAVDPATGRLLATVQAGPGLVELLVDDELDLYLLDELGTLRALRLSSHFAVV